MTSTDDICFGEMILDAFEVRLGKAHREARLPHHKRKLRVGFFLKCDLTLVVFALRRCAFTLIFGVSNISITFICHLSFKGFAAACMPL